MKQFWIKITSFDKVEMGGFRYSDAEISVDPKCGENYDDFKNAVHVLEAQPVIELLDKLATDLSVIYQQACSCCESDEDVDREANKMIAMINEFKEQIK